MGRYIEQSDVEDQFGIDTVKVWSDLENLGTVNTARITRAIAYAEDIAQYQFTLARIDPGAYEAVYVLQQSHMGYAFHRDTDPRVLEPLRKALDELRTDGTVDRIYNRYLHRPTSTFVGGLR